MIIHILEIIRAIYPSIQGGFAYWHTRPDGTPWDHPMEGLVWENTEFEKPSWEQIEAVLPAVELLKIKEAKIAEIKTIRDQQNIEPIVDQKAFLLDSGGNKTAQESNFIFYTNRHPSNPASDPASILSAVMILGNPIPYFTEDSEGNKIAVEIDVEVARNLAYALAQRNNTNYKSGDAFEASIMAAETIEEIESITRNISL